MITVSQVDWSKRRDVLQLVRYIVFVEEQQVPVELEWDGMDESSVHFLATEDSGLPIGTARLLPSGQIGRMAVLTSFRRRGIGSQLLRTVTDFALQADYKAVFLHAQTHAIDFYSQHGFVVQGEEFMDAGIPHKEMVFRP